MFWADRVAEKIIKSNKHKPYWVDDMKTPSGRIHVGSLRGIITHDLIYKALLDTGVKATFSYVIDDHDPMDGLPVYLDEQKYKKYMGQPLNTIPSPKAGYKSYAQYFAKDFIEVFNACDCQPRIIWASQLYQSGKMNAGIKKVLDSALKIRRIYQKISGSAKPDDWYPFQIICPKCGKSLTSEDEPEQNSMIMSQKQTDLVPVAAVLTIISAVFMAGIGYIGVYQHQSLLDLISSPEYFGPILISDLFGFLFFGVIDIICAGFALVGGVFILKRKHLKISVLGVIFLVAAVLLTRITVMQYPYGFTDIMLFSEASVLILSILSGALISNSKAEFT